MCGDRPCLGTRAASGRHLPGLASAGAWHCGAGQGFQMWKGLRMTCAFRGLVGTTSVLWRWHEGQTCRSRKQRARLAVMLWASWARTGGVLWLSGPMSPTDTHKLCGTQGTELPTAPEALPEKLDGPGLPCGQHTCDTPLPNTHTQTHTRARAHTILEGPRMFCLSLLMACIWTG